ASGASYPPITVTVNVSGAAPASVTNTAIVSGGGDANSANNTASDPTTINPSGGGGAGTATNVVISQIYGGGGNSGATYQNDFVELFNPLSTAVNLSTWSVQYASSAGTTWQNRANLSGFIQPHHYYLIQLASNAAVGALLPVADATNTSINMSATSGKVALVSSQTALIGSNPVSSNGVVDFVGYGTANAFEGAATAPSPGNTTSIVRKNGGYSDTNDNSADFNTSTPPVPRNSASPANSPPVADLTISMTHSGTFTQAEIGDTYSITITNGGSTASVGAVTVTDTLPAGLSATAIGGSGWTANLGALTCTRSDALAVGAGYPPITVTVNVATNAPSSVTNMATVSGGGQTNTLNDTASDPTSITALTPIQSWRLQWFGSTANSGPGADTAITTSDGMPNLLKYALGLNPLVATNNPVVGDISTGYLRLTLPKNPNATDISFHVEVSPDLVPASWTSSGTTIDQNTATLLQVHVTTPVGSAARNFIRLRVSRP
ncbi:MAG: endonuclease mitochondrial, partial [Verrucomicrobiota bacterium]